MSDIYLAVSETPTVVTLTSAVINSAVASSVTVMNTVTVSLASVPTHAITGTVTANVTTLAFTTQGGIASSNEGSIPTYGIQLGYNNSDGAFNLVDVSNGYPIRGSVAVEGLDALENQTQIRVTTSGSVLALLSSALPAGTNQIGVVTANTFALQGTAVTTSNFTSTTASTVLANFNATREVLTIFNEGSGNLHIAPGATCTTVQYQVRLSSGDYYEVPNHQTTITHSAVFATAGTARVTQVS